MKNILFFTLLLTFGINPSFYSLDNKTEISLLIKKNKLCKTWYVTEAFELRDDRPRRDRTNQAAGSTFTFNKDGSFFLDDKSRRTEKPMEGTWKENGKNSISILMDKLELKFEIKELTKKKLYIIGSEERRADRKMHIVFSSSFVKPKEEKELNYNDLDDTVEVTEEADAYDDVAVPDMEIDEAIEEVSEEPIEVTDVEFSNKIIKKETDLKSFNLCKTWNADMAKYSRIPGEIVDVKGTQFTFNLDRTVNLNEVNKGVAKTQYGTWRLKYGNKIQMNLKGEVRTFILIENSTNILILKEISGQGIKFYFISN